MLLYSPNNTPRLTYILDFINKELFDEPFRITTDKEEFLAYTQPKINYSDEEFSKEEFFIQRSRLLFETGVRPQAIECFELNFFKVFFQTPGDYPFDIFAASFYLISRYEEYLPFEKDQYGRFPHSASLAFKENFLPLPLVNIWLNDFKKALHDKFPSLPFHRPSFKFLPTYDIDMAYSYLHKGLWRNLGGFARSLMKGEWVMMKDRLQVLLGSQKDPFDAYEWLDSVHLYCRMRGYYFFLLAKDRRGYDKNISRRSRALQQLIRYLAAGYTVGIHPSWQSGDREDLLKEELNWLETLVDREIGYSRQHYIRFTLPETYRRLVRTGIDKDFSMGYGSINGFRASVASSFYWYDLQREEKTDLLLFPFCFMDANAYYEQGYSPTQAFRELMDLYRIVKKVNGLMVTIWHNNFLGSDPAFAGWKEVYEVFLKEEVFWDM